MNRTMLLRTLSAALLAAAALAVPAQTVIDMPSLSIEGSTLDVAVSYDSARQVYRYQYTVHAAATNKARIDSFAIDINGREPRPQLDPDLQNNIVRKETTRQLQPSTAIPVGITVPDPGNTNAGVGAQGWVFFTSRRGTWDIEPGASTGDFILESKRPPGIRNARISPNDLEWINISLSSPPESEFYPDSAEVYELKTTVIGPSDPDEANLFLGGGQSPANVNPFLRYAAPTDTRTKLPAGTTSYVVNVFYGQTTNPATFTATLNGIDVRSQFHPIPGTAEVVRIGLGQGSNKLQLSIEGTTSSGRSARDTDTLTFLVD
ncbi:MAG: hypothetical protein ACLGH0_01390 [Thermoanaerobaculia bacterium]